MVRFRPYLLAAALLSGAIPLRASSETVTLVAPLAEQRLIGGDLAVLQWSAVGLPAGSEEWEAFLSVDGGAHYPVRITPHLDATIRAFRWRVPNVATERATILLRFGDEHEERVVALPSTFVITPHYAAIDFGALDAAPESETGESALKDGEPTVEWVSGDRAGQHLVTHGHTTSTSSSRHSFDRNVPVESAALPSRQTAAIDTNSSITRRVLGRCPIGLALRIIAVRPLLLLSTRLNV